MAQPRYHICTKKEGCYIYNPGEYSPTSLPKPQVVPLPGAIRQVSLQDWGLEDRHSLESGSQRAVCLIIRADLSSSDDKTAGVCQSVKGVWWRQAPHKCSTTLPPPLLQGSATPWRGGSAVPLFRYRVLGHRHWKKGKAPEGSNKTLGIRKVLYMQYMA